MYMEVTFPGICYSFRLFIAAPKACFGLSSNSPSFTQDISLYKHVETLTATYLAGPISTDISRLDVPT